MLQFDLWRPMEVGAAFARRAGAKEGVDGADSTSCRVALRQRSDSEANSLKGDPGNGRPGR